MKKKIYKVDGMHCTSCALMIESDLEDAGVKAQCNYAKETLTVEYDEKTISEKDIENSVKNSGYRILPS
jgi:P-type Cu+ transporter